MVTTVVGFVARVILEREKRVSIESTVLLCIRSTRTVISSDECGARLQSGADGLVDTKERYRGEEGDSEVHVEGGLYCVWNGFVIVI